MKKLNKNVLIGLGTVGAVVAPVASVVSCGLFGGSDESDFEFMNYVDYISDGSRSLIESRYTYTEFGDLPELKVAIDEKRIAGGIGSDYYNAYLAGTGALSKIDFARLYKMPELADSSKLEKKLTDDIYTPVSMGIMKAFDNDLILRLDNGKPAKWDTNGRKIALPSGEAVVHDLDNDGEDDHLWEYMAPYFSQNKIIAVNIKRLYDSAPVANKALLSKDNGKTFISNAELMTEIQKDAPSMTYDAIFEVLRTKFGASDIIVNNYMRDNMMIGSEITNNGVVQAPTDIPTATKQIDAFFGMVKKFGKVRYADSGVDTLNSLVYDQKASSQVGIMYNGDALYSYFGGSNGDKADNGVTRVITPKNSTFLLDGMVIPSYMNEPENIADKLKMYDIVGEALYGGISNEAKQGQGQGSTLNPSFKRLNNVFANFDNVNYTPAFKELYTYVMDNEGYFYDADAKTKDDDAFDIMGSTDAARTALGANFSKNITSIVDGEFEQNISNIYNSKF